MDRWANRNYATGLRGCFLFALDCMDAQLGSDLVLRNKGQWGQPSEFWAFLRRRAEMDYFDVVGRRVCSATAQPGDLLQTEEDAGSGRIHLHWGIVSDEPDTIISFGAPGLFEMSFAEVHRTSVAVRAWRPLTAARTPDGFGSG